MAGSTNERPRVAKESVWARRVRPRDVDPGDDDGRFLDAGVDVAVVVGPEV